MAALHDVAAASDITPVTLDAIDSVAFALGAIAPVPTVVGAVALVVGLAFLAYGAASGRDAVRILRATATDPRGLDGAERRIRVTGRATAIDEETLPSPFGGGQCLCVDYDVSEFRNQGKGQSWVTIDGGEAGVPFRVDDGGTGVRVDPATATFSFEVDEEIEVDAADEPPERVREFVDTVDEVDATEAGYEIGPLTIGNDPRRRYLQRVLRPGDEVTVVGDAAAFPDAPVGEVKSRISDGSPFVVSDASARRTALRRVGRSAVPVVFGAVVLVVAALALSPAVAALI